MSGPESDLVLTILMPVRNESLNLRVMLKILGPLVEVPHEVLIVHDDKDDDSLPVVEDAKSRYPDLRSVHNDRGRGVINAVRAGVAAARGKYVLIFAADEIGPVFAIHTMLGLMDDGADLVSATRYAHGGRRLGGSLIGGILSRLANFLFRRISGCAFTDLTTGIKMFRREVFDRLNLESNPVGWAFAFEMSIKAQMLGLKLGEVPIVSIDRIFGGESSFRVSSWTTEYLRWFLWGLKRRRKVGGSPAIAVRKPFAAEEGI